MAEVILKNIKKVYPHQDTKKKKKRASTSKEGSSSRMIWNLSNYSFPGLA